MQMQTARAFRLVEASLTLFFFLTAARTVVAVLLGLVTGGLTEGQVTLSFVNAHLLIAGAVAMSWFSPRPRSRLPGTLLLTALVVAIARVPMSELQPVIRFYSALVAFAFGGVYIAALIRANHRTFLLGLVTAITLDQLSRAAGFSYDITLRGLWPLPRLLLQIGLSVLAVWVSLEARGRAKNEPYEPANLTLLHGLSFGSLLFLEMAVLAMPNVIARWSSLDYAAVAPWLALASAVTLSPGLRKQVARTLEMFDERSRGWVWILLLALLIVIGNRTGGPGAAVVLVVAQVVVLMMAWWLTEGSDPHRPDQVGPGVAFGLAFYVILSYVYLLIFEDAHIFLPLAGQALTLHLIAVVILGVVLVGWRQPDPWHLDSPPQFGLPLAFAVLAFVGVVIAVRPLPVEAPAENGALRVASYDIHYGYGPDWRYDLELTALSIEIAQPDIVALQRVDVGRQASYGVDQVAWLARRLGMYAVYQPTIERTTGLAILSRWPVEESGGVLLSSNLEQMGVAYALVRREPGTGAVGVYSTRLSPEDEERLIQVGGLLGYVGNANTVVVGGDMRMAEGDDTYTQLIIGNLSDSNAALNIVEDFTYPASNPARRFDYLFLRGLTPIESQKVCGPPSASDHCLVVVETLRP